MAAVGGASGSSRGRIKQGLQLIPLPTKIPLLTNLTNHRRHKHIFWTDAEIEGFPLPSFDDKPEQLIEANGALVMGGAFVTRARYAASVPVGR
jgi:hypothetical protein